MVTTTVGQYLVRRLKEVGIDTVFGLPGDYNMVNIYIYFFFKKKIQATKTPPLIL